MNKIHFILFNILPSNDVCSGYFEHNGIGILSSISRDLGWDVEHTQIISREGLDEACKNKWKKDDIDLLAISYSTLMFPYVKEYLEKVHIDNSIKVILGGVGVTVQPEMASVLPKVSYIVLGEADIAFQEFLLNFPKYYKSEINNIKGISSTNSGNNKYYLCSPPENLDLLPFMDRNIIPKIYNTSENSIMMYPTRGCPFKCFFCIHNFSEKKYDKKVFRYRTPKNVIQEIKEIKKKRKVKFIYFADDCFTATPVYWLEELMREIKNLEIPFSCSANPLTLTKIKIDLLAKGGCKQISFGIESGNQFIREKLLNRRYENKKIIEIAELLHENNIEIATLNMIGFPDDNLSYIADTIELNAQINPVYAHCSFLYPFPGTQIFDYCNNIIPDFKFSYLSNFYDESIIVNNDSDYKKMQEIRLKFHNIVKSIQIDNKLLSLLKKGDIDLFYKIKEDILLPTI